MIVGGMLWLHAGLHPVARTIAAVGGLEMEPDIENRKRAALQRCDQMVAEQSKWATRAKWLYHVCQTLAIIAGAVAPVLIFVLPDDGDYRLRQMLKAAVAT